MAFLVAGFFCRINAFLPPSPQPPSRREGGILTLFRRGLRPRHPGNRVGSGTGFYFGSRSLFAFRRKRCPQRQESSTNVGFSGAARVQPRGCKGRSPLHEITLVSPFPTGEGGWGDGGKKLCFCQTGACPGRHGKVNSGSSNPAEAAKPILQHPTSQPPCKSASEGWNRARTSAPTNNNSFEKSSGGSGGLFQESPGVSPSPRQARRRRARMQKPAVRQAAGRRTATATPQRAEEGRERDREEPSMQTGVTEENSEVKVSLI